MYLSQLRKLIQQHVFIASHTFISIAVATRLKSVKNIQKITKSMKMVSAAKFAKAERELKPARVYGAGAKGLYKIRQLHLFFFPIVKGKTLFTG